MCANFGFGALGAIPSPCRGSTLSENSFVMTVETPRSERPIHNATKNRARGAPTLLRLSRTWWTDARHFQIAALSTLLAFNLGWLDFGAQPINSAAAIVAALATQALCTRAF